jgi:hypothetical protein
MEAPMTTPFPNAALPQAFSIGDQVKWFISESAVSPYVGRVYAINPKTVKVYVTWPVGGNTQHSPEELLIVPPEQGQSVINAPAPGYDSWEVRKSEKTFGKLTPATIQKMAAALAESEIVEEVVKQASDLKSAGFPDIVAHDRLTSVFSGIASDAAIRQAMSQVYSEIL